MAIAPLTAAPPLGVRDAMRLIHEVLDRTEAGGPLTASSAAAALGQVDRVMARLDALRLGLVAAADRAAVAAQSGLTDTGAWLSAQTKAGPAAAAADVRLAAALDKGLPATREALASGEVSAQHASAPPPLPDFLQS